MRIAVLALAVATLLCCQGCGGISSMSPGICSGDINAAYIAPDNVLASVGTQWTFSAIGTHDRSSGCLDNGVHLVDPVWAVSDPKSASLAPLHGTNKMTATCNAASANPVIITVTVPVNTSSPNTVTGTAQMTCR